LLCRYLACFGKAILGKREQPGGRLDRANMPRVQMGLGDIRGRRCRELVERCLNIFDGTSGSGTALRLSTGGNLGLLASRMGICCAARYMELFADLSLRRASSVGKPCFRFAEISAWIPKYCASSSWIVA
jgi:hypothetical protein